MARPLRLDCLIALKSVSRRSRLHRALEFGGGFLADPEVHRGERRDAFGLFMSQGDALRGGSEFDELFLVVNVREGRSYPVIPEQPLQSRLAQGPAIVLEEAQLLHFPNAVQQPTPRTMVPMIIRRENGFRRVMALEQAG